MVYLWQGEVILTNNWVEMWWMTSAYYRDPYELVMWLWFSSLGGFIGRQMDLGLHSNFPGALWGCPPGLKRPCTRNRWLAHNVQLAILWYFWAALKHWRPLSLINALYTLLCQTWSNPPRVWACGGCDCFDSRARVSLCALLHIHYLRERCHHLRETGVKGWKGRYWAMG